METTNTRQSGWRAALAQARDGLRTTGPLWTGSLILDRVGVPVFRLWPQWRVSPETLRQQLTDIFRAWGMSEEHTAITVEHILYADLHGIESHGSGMLMKYHRQRSTGGLTMTPRIEVTRNAAGTAVVDGGGGLGHVPADAAMRLAIEKCRETGVGAVAVHNSGHFGAAGSYVALAAREGCIGIATTNTVEPAVVPTHGRDARLGTNPIAFAAPAARNRPFLLDMATSTVPLGALVAAWRKGRAVPAGWAQDADGRPLTHARHAFEERKLTPLGSSAAMRSHKGYGLSAMVEILCSVLPGRETGGDRGTGRAGHFFLALDPSRFADPGQFEGRLDGLLDSLRATPPLVATQPVLVAGDPEYEAHTERAAGGIPLPRPVVEDLRTVCRSAGAAFVLEP